MKPDPQTVQKVIQYANDFIDLMMSKNYDGWNLNDVLFGPLSIRMQDLIQQNPDDHEMILVGFEAAYTRIIEAAKKLRHEEGELQAGV